MKSFESFSRKKVVTGLAIAIGALGLTACGENETMTGPREEGVYKENFWAYPDEDSPKRIEGQCIGDALYIKQIRGWDADDEYTWLNDPACSDNILETSDNINSAVAEAIGG